MLSTNHGLRPSKTDTNHVRDNYSLIKSNQIFKKYKTCKLLICKFFQGIPRNIFWGSLFIPDNEFLHTCTYKVDSVGEFMFRLENSKRMNYGFFFF